MEIKIKRTKQWITDFRGEKSIQYNLQIDVLSLSDYETSLITKYYLPSIDSQNLEKHFHGGPQIWNFVKIIKEEKNLNNYSIIAHSELLIAMKSFENAVKKELIIAITDLKSIDAWKGERTEQL